MTITQAELDAIRARAEAASELPFYSATATDVIEEDVPKLLAEVERLNSLTEKLADENSWVKTENRMYELAVVDDDTTKKRYADEMRVLDGFLQDIDTHIRATPEPLSYIVKTMRKYMDYREGIVYDK